MNAQILKLHLNKSTKKILRTDFIKINDKIQVFRNENLSFGDYSSNILFLIAKIKKITPQAAFELLKKNIEKLKFVKKIEFVNGYLNFFIDEKIFIDDFQKILKGKKIFNPCPRKSVFSPCKSVVLEYISANPTGELTIGNARGAVIGDSLLKILKLSNANIKNEYYVNDRGFQIETLGKSVLSLLGKIPEEENFYKGEYLNKITSNFKTGESKFNKFTFAPKSKLRFDFGKISKFNDPQAIGKFVADIILNDSIKPTLKNFGIEFDNYFYETSLYKDSLYKKVFEFLNKKSFIVIKEGATWIALTKIGEQKDEVIIKNNGEYTYFWSDILYHYHKFFIRKFSAITIVSADHFDHVRRMKVIFEKIFNVNPDNIKFIVYQMVHLVKGDELFRISKRRGVYITLDDLIQEVGLDSVKFFFLKYASETTVAFDLELAKKQSEENPVWYLHYAYVRLKKILEKSQNISSCTDPLETPRLPKSVNSEQINIINFIKNYYQAAQTWIGNWRAGSGKAQPLHLPLHSAIFFSLRSEPSKNCLREVSPEQLFALLNNSNYLVLFRKIHQFSDLLSEISNDLRPNLLCGWLLDFAKMIHNFYEKEKIIGAENEKEKLLFIIYLMKILELGFELIGIKPKEEL